MDLDPIVIPILGIFFALGVPSIALAAHFVLRPLVKDIVGAIQASKHREDDRLDERLARLEEAYYQLDQRVHRLAEVDRFHRELESGEGRDEAVDPG